MKRAVLATAAGAAAVAAFLLLTLPDPPAIFSVDRAGEALARRTVRGAYHIHSTRSDGAAGRAAIAAAAAHAGLQFAIFTDHGDGTRAPDPPAYLHGVLCIDGVEISTNGGHYVALGLEAAPYPLGGDAEAVVDDVNRLGGFGIAAHPQHPREALAWTAWDAPIDGLEWTNLDVEWRNESPVRLARVLFDYLFRPAGAVASVLDRPTATLAKWDSLAATREIVGLAAADAHGSRMGGLEEGSRAFAPGPSYEASFAALSNRIILNEPFSGNPAADARLLLDALRAGRLYTVVDGLADGILLRQSAGGFAVASALPPIAEVRPVRSGARTRLEIDLPNAPGAPPIPWVVTNWTGPIAPSALADPVEPANEPLAAASSWRVEKDPRSTGTVIQDGPGIALEYRLAEGQRSSQFAGAVIDLAGQNPIARLTFRGRADRPMRVSVQLRFAAGDERLVRSVYLDEMEREVTVDVASMRPARGGQRTPLPGPPRSLLFVVDLVNARPGDSGTLRIRDIRTALAGGATTSSR